MIRFSSPLLAVCSPGSALLVSQLWEAKTHPSAWLCGRNLPELSLPSLFVELSFISWPVLCTESSCQSEPRLGSGAALARQKSEDKVVKTTAENRIIKPLLDQCSPHSRLSWTQWEAPKPGDHSTVGTEASVTKQSCSGLPLSIKISFYGTLYTWPFEQSVAINGVCILEPDLGKEQEIIRLAGEEGVGRASTTQLFMSTQRHREMKCV